MNRFSSRRRRLDSSFLTPRLQGALGYDRIAGYFSSSLLEVTGEALEAVAGPIRMVCNSAIEPKDLITARLAQSAMRREWCESQPEALGDGAKVRFKRLYEFLKSGKLAIKVLPDDGSISINLKAQVRKGDLRLILGTDAASEGLNLQRLGTLINLDLPWNPSRLEQRKGRIQRIGQVRDSVDIYNLRYAGSVEDRIHQMLSSRLQGISNLFGQLPDVLEDVWIDVAIGEVERARRIIDAVPRQHPLQLRYHKITKVDWESCAKVLDTREHKAYLSRGWR